MMKKINASDILMACLVSVFMCPDYKYPMNNAIVDANTESMTTTHTMVMMSSMRCCFLSALYFPVDDA